MEDKQPAPKVRELRPAETEHRITVAEFLDIRGFGFQQMKAFGNSVKSFANAIGTVYTTKPCRWYGESRSYPRDLLNTLWREWSQHGGRKFRK